VCRALRRTGHDAGVDDASVLQVTVARGIATLTLDSPDDRNALSRRMRAQLRSALAEALADDAVRVVVLDHTGRVFCSGMDLKEATGGSSDDQGVREFPELLQLLWSSPKPVLAVVRGPARAGGVGLLAACDVVVAGTSATFAFSEVRLGLVPAVISAVVLPRMVPHIAHRLMLTGQVFDADTASAGGLVDVVVPDADVDGEVRAQLVHLTAGAPAALAETKRLLRAGGERLEFDELLEISARRFAGDEGQEGIAAFREKRCPLGADGLSHPDPGATWTWGSDMGATLLSADLVLCPQGWAEHRVPRRQGDLEDVVGDQLAEAPDVGTALELEAHVAHAAEPQVELGVEVEVAGRLDGERLDLAVRQRGEVALLAGHPLHVHGDEPLVTRRGATSPPN
jgi:methylglutaconyl-CoA hydratase